MNKERFIDCRYAGEVPEIIYEDVSTVRGGEYQCDCACVAANYSLLHTGPIGCAIHPCSPSVVRRNEAVIDVPLGVGNYYAMLVPGAGCVVLNACALKMANHFSTPRRLDAVPSVWQQAWGEKIIQSTLQQMLKVGILVDGDAHMHSVPADISSVLAAWLHVTNRCNLRCAYCYVRHTAEDMPLETGYAAIDGTFRSALAHGYGEVKLKYAGGEPLLRFEQVAALHMYAYEQATQAGLTLDGVVLSNGTLLTEAIVARMRDLGLRLMVSLDGLGEMHDVQRPYAHGYGSCADVQRGIELALAGGLVPDISITVSAHTVQGLPDVVAWVLERDVPFSLNFYREHAVCAGAGYGGAMGTDGPGMRLGDDEQVVAGMLAAYKVIEANMPRRSVLASLVDRANLAVPHMRICSVGKHYVVFGCDGRVVRCQMRMQEVVGTVDAHDPLAQVRHADMGMQNVAVDAKEGCAVCVWRYWCGGGCPLVTHAASPTGRWDERSPYCNIYQALFPEVVRLEGLRLLRGARGEG